MNRHAPRLSLEAFLVDDEPTVEYDDTAVLEQSRLVQEAGARLARCEQEESTIRDAAEVLVHLNAIIKEVAADDTVSESTELAVRQATARGLAQVGSVVTDIASTESWSTPKERVMLSMEAINETLGKIWEELKKALKRVMDAFVEFLMRHIRTLDIAYSKFKAMNSALRHPLNWPSAEDIPFAAAGKLSLNGKVSVTWVTRVLDDLQSVGRADLAQLKDCQSAAETIRAAVQSGIRNHDVDTASDTVERAKAQYTKDIAKTISGISQGKIESDHVTSGELSGGYYISGQLDTTTYTLNRPKDVTVDKLVLPTNTAVKNAVATGLQWTREQITAQQTLVKDIKHMLVDTELDGIAMKLQDMGTTKTRELMTELLSTPRLLAQANRPMLAYFDAVLPTYVSALDKVIKYGQISQ